MIPKISATGRPLKCYSQPSALFFESLGVYSDTINLIRSHAMGAGVAKALGSGRAVLLKNHGVVMTNGWTSPYTTRYPGMTYGYPYSSGVYGTTFGSPYSSGVYGTPYVSGYNNLYTGQSGVGIGSQGISVSGLPIFRW